MDRQLFETLGKIAGLAGLCVGLVLLIFREIIKRTNAVKDNSVHVIALLRLITILTFATGITGITGWFIVSMIPPVPHVITGGVVDAKSHQPIQDAQVNLVGRPEYGRTDSAGNFTVPLPSAAKDDVEYTVFVVRAGYNTIFHNARLGQNLPIDLTPVASISKDPGEAGPPINPKPHVPKDQRVAAQALAIPLPVPYKGDVQATATWVDPDTHLTWTNADNGTNITYAKAAVYCQGLKLQGLSWRLPTLDELEGIWDSSVGVSGRWMGGDPVLWHIKGNLQPSGWTWSDTGTPTSVWHMSFRDNAKYETPVDNWYDSRAFCVSSAK